jgi:putative membrane protein
MLPMILRVFYLAFREDFARHKRLARWTLPIWLYVSVTGVLVYVMLYQVKW